MIMIHKCKRRFRNEQGTGICVRRLRTHKAYYNPQMRSNLTTHLQIKAVKNLLSIFINKFSFTNLTFALCLFQKTLRTNVFFGICKKTERNETKKLFATFVQLTYKTFKLPVQQPPRLMYLLLLFRKQMQWFPERFRHAGNITR